MMPTEIKSPAIAAMGERGRPGVREVTTNGDCVIVYEELSVTVVFASMTVFTVELSGETTVSLLMSEFFMEGLLTVTK